MSRVRFKNIIIFMLIIQLMLQICPTCSYNISADSNAPTDQGNGWWNTSKGLNWYINTTNNIFENKNITVFKSIEINDSGELTFQNCTVIVHNNIIIKQNGTLNLINTTLKFNSTNSIRSELHVKSGGSLFISDFDNDPGTSYDASNITSNITDGNHRFIFNVFSQSNFIMKNSELHHCGYSIFSPDLFGLYLATDNSTIENNTFADNYAGLVIESCSKNRIHNNKFINNEKYGCFIAFCGNNYFQKNTLINNTFNFGLLLNKLNQSNNITQDNLINGKAIYYFNNTKNININSSQAAGFIGILDSNNISISDQSLAKNFEGMLLLGCNNTLVQNSNFTENNYGVMIDKSKNVTFQNCNIYNNTDIGLQIRNSELIINNSTIDQNNIPIFELSDASHVRAINCTLNYSKVQLVDIQSKFEYQYYLHLQTKNHYGVPIGNITIDIYDGNNKYIRNCTTNETGRIKWIPLTGYEVKSSGQKNITMSNHRLHTIFSGMAFNQYINMNESQDIIMYLNHPPEILNKPVAKYYIDEDSLFNYDFDCIDNDTDNVTWHYTSNANWLNPIGIKTGIINGTPTNPDPGKYFLNVSVNDSYNGLDFYNFTIIVNNTNDKPHIIPKQEVETAYEDVLYSHCFEVSDPDMGFGELITWSLKTNATWLSPINKWLGTFFGTPLQKHVGIYFINITCKDYFGEHDSYNFSVRVYPTNDKPEIINPENTTVYIAEESTYYYDFDYFDEDYDSVQWYVDKNATWLGDIDRDTGELSGTPHDFDVGMFYVNVSCEDPSNAHAYQNFTIIVGNTNDRPSFIDLDNQTFYALEDEYFEQSFNIYDSDAVDNYIYTLFIELPDATGSGRNSHTRANSNKDVNESWLQLTYVQGTRICKVFGIPENEDVGILKANIICTDISGLTSQINFSIIINNTNDPPRIINRENDWVYTLEDHEYYHDFDYIDIDGDNVTWSMNTNAFWLSDIDNLTGELFGTPTQENLGEFYVEIFCHDPSGYFDTQQYIIQVNNTNDPPILLNPCPKTVITPEDEFYQYDFNSLDKDSILCYWSSNSNASWLNDIDRLTGIINGTPGDYDVGIYYVNITCSDNEPLSVSLSVYWNYTLIVNNTNDDPIITNGYLANRAVNMNERYYFKFQFFDIDGDLVTWKINTNASLWLNFDPELAVIQGTPTRINIGIYYVNISCYDSYGGMGFLNYNIRVKGTKNHPPELYDGRVTPMEGTKDTVFTFFVTYRDIDGDWPNVVVVKIGNTPLFLELLEGDDPISGLIYSNSTTLSEGFHLFYFQAMDAFDERAIIIDNTTSSSGNQGVIEIKKTDVSEEEKLEINYLIIVVSLIILVIIIIGVILPKRKRRQYLKPKEEKKKRTFKLLKQKAKQIPSKLLSKKRVVSPEPTELAEEVSADFPEEEEELGELPTELPLEEEITPTEEEAQELSQAIDELITGELLGEEKPIPPEIPMEEESIAFDEEPGPGEVPSEEEAIPTEEAEEAVVPAAEAKGPEEEIGIEEPPLPEEQALLEEEFVTTELIEPEQQVVRELLMCPECGEVMEEEVENCPGCGVRFIYDDVEDEFEATE